MKNKIFYATLAACVLAIAISVGIGAALTFVLDTAAPVVSYLIAAAIAVFFSLLTATGAAFLVSGIVTGKLEKADLSHPESARVDTELRPLFKRLAEQNYKSAKAADELAARYREFASITENMSEGMIILDRMAQVITINESAKDALGTSTAPTDIFGIPLSSSMRQTVRAALAGQNVTHAFRRGEKYYSVIATPVRTGGVSDGAVIMIFDETEKEARETLRREFTSNVSHELKTPLTAISGYAELIENGMTGAEDTVRFAASIHKEASRLQTLVGDIIRLSRLDGGEIPYDGAVDLSEVAAEVHERLIPVAENAGVTFTIETAGQVAVLGNRQILSEILFNLSDNGIKYNREGGHVTLAVLTKENRPVVRVSDDGIGIPKDKQDRVFERFYRVDKSHSRSVGGTGLGLSIVKHAAAFHHAEIALESEEGRGTVVTITFPSPKDEI